MLSVTRHNTYRLFRSAVVIRYVPEYTRYKGTKLEHLFSISDFFVFGLVSSLCFYFFGLACVVVFSYPVRWHFTCLTLEFVIFILLFGLPLVSQSVTPESVSL